MTSPSTSSAEFFEAKYKQADDADPWNFATDDYELQRYRLVLKALEGKRYKQCFEPGCSVGILTQMLATLCEHVDACDFSATAVERAKVRCSVFTGVNIECKALTGDEMWADYDLIVLCEIGYYFTPAAWQALVEKMVTATQPGTVILASHWLGTSHDHIQHGDEVHHAINHPLLHLTMRERHAGFCIDRWTRQ